MNSEQFYKWRQKYHNAGEAQPPPIIMGILNVTTDSFSDGGKFLQLNQAMQHAQAMINAGADIIDIGGESTRPGAAVISEAEELARVIPIIKSLRAASDICISIDTGKVAVMQAAVATGANFINDVTALAMPKAMHLVAELKVPVCLMHMQGTPQTMQNNPQYTTDVIDEINVFFQKKITACLTAGIKVENIFLDPGFGFGKLTKHNLQIIRQFAKFKKHGLPLMLGVSRKSTLGEVLQSSIDDRLIGGIVASMVAIQNGSNVIRTHDIYATKQACSMLRAITQAVI